MEREENQIEENNTNNNEGGREERPQQPAHANKNSKPLEFNVSLVDDFDLENDHTLFKAFYYKTEVEIGLQTNFSLKDITLYNMKNEKIDIELTIDSKPEFKLANFHLIFAQKVKKSKNT